MLKAQNIQKSYNALKVLKGVNFEAKKGEIISIAGASGAGKSTFLHILGTLDKPDNGIVAYNDEEINGMGQKKLARFRNRNIGFVFQFHHLLPEFTALENVCIPAFIANVSKKSAVDSAKELLNILDLNERLNHKPSELSGGELQRVAVARALINKPLVVLADEPSGNLDSVNAKHLHELFFRLRDKFQQTFVIVTHNMELANMADRMLTMKDGILIA